MNDRDLDKIKLSEVKARTQSEIEMLEIMILEVVYIVKMAEESEVEKVVRGEKVKEPKSQVNSCYWEC